ncbi:zinc finger matrin-type protein 5 isoform X1 [Tachypleus tridentatus]|uniref:zinc finger matrin-type protein 5 isoform X1 n=2 Tax=Tachypleus tridentatus TaxID=6853 RepID=UPI003FD1084B
MVEMGKRYYCDYCDRSFPDSADNRKKHIQGVQHQRLCKLHYDAYKEPEEILKDEMEKKPCHQFQKMGYCNFGPGCKYSHITEEEMQQLREEVQQQSLQKQGAAKYEDEKEPDLDSWLVKRTVNKEIKSPNQPSIIDIEAWSLSPELASVLNLPSSLLPPNPQDFLIDVQSEWG